MSANKLKAWLEQLCGLDVACVNCKKPVRVTALNAVRCQRCSKMVAPEWVEGFMAMARMIVRLTKENESLARQKWNAHKEHRALAAKCEQLERERNDHRGMLGLDEGDSLTFAIGHCGARERELERELKERTAQLDNVICRLETQGRPAQAADAGWHEALAAVRAALTQERTE